MRFYITEETKQELEAKIKELNLHIQENKDKGYYALESYHGGRKMICEEILQSSIVLPVEENFEVNNTIISEKKWMFDKYPNGVIINKQ